MSVSERHPDADAAELSAAVEGARGGEEEGFSALFKLVQPKLVAYLRTLVGEEAEDVASDAWLHISRDIGQFRGDGTAFRGWVRAVARNRAVDHLRQVRARPQGISWEVCGAEAEPADRDAAEVVLDALATAHVLKLIARLPADQGEAVLLRVVIGLDSPAAGRVLGKQPGAVRMAARRGLRSLAAQWGRPGGTPTPPAPVRDIRGIRRVRPQDRQRGEKSHKL
ncbi:RNA polymerase sigma factor [Streptomyces sp. NPDC091272]|uniref:RNA polymerase sigma factor n=1 Tax=Streptomyces sp. NPDC091272 TaxID=3365981 RepID=UPI0037FBD1B5